MPRIFISYRRDDSAAHAGRLYDRLETAFGPNQVFQDVFGIDPGVDFRGKLAEEVSKCDVLLAVIGPQWLNITDKNNKRRLDDPDDFVRIEIKTALTRDTCRVIPVLIGNATMPPAEELPDDLRELAYKNAVRVRDGRDFNHDVSDLIDYLKEMYPPQPETVFLQTNPLSFAAVIGITFIVIAALVLTNVISLGGNGASTPTAVLNVLDHAANFSGRNADWTPVTQAFNGVNMVLVPTGCFMMGDDTDTGNPSSAHEVCLTKPYWIDQTEVTNALFARFGGRAANPSYTTEADFPRTVITKDEAQQYCVQRGGRLPTEAEWEFAARGPDNLLYPWGNVFLADHVVYSSSGQLQLLASGSRPLGTSWVGALDLSGSVWEWVYDFYAPYPQEAGPYNDPVVDSGAGDGVIRGGSYTSAQTTTLYASNRLARPATGTGLDIGFRCVIEPQS